MHILNHCHVSEHKGMTKFLVKQEAGWQATKLAPGPTQSIKLSIVTAVHTDLVFSRNSYYARRQYHPV